MSNFTPLTQNAVLNILSGIDIKNPVFQIRAIKTIRVSESLKYRLVLSDGNFLTTKVTLETHLNKIFTDKEIDNLSIIRVNRFTVRPQETNQAEIPILEVNDFDLLHKGSEVGEKIGDPSGITNDMINVESATDGSTSSSSNMNRSISEKIAHPISSLSPYHTKWVIKTRVINKTPIIPWSNDRGSGKRFSFDLRDESGEIRVTAFNDLADKFFDLVEIDKVYFISKCSLKPANKRFNKLKNDFELSATPETTILPCEEDMASIPTLQYDFKSISDIAELQQNNIVDVIGVVSDVSDLQTVQARATGRNMAKRELTLIDPSNASINLTLWGNEAESFDPHSQPVVLLKSAMIKEYSGGKTLTIGRSGFMKLNPPIEKARQLQEWFNSGEATNISLNVSLRTGFGPGGLSTPWMSFDEDKMNQLGFGEKPDYFQLKGQIQSLKTPNVVYKGCPQCNKKIIDQEDETYRCEKCNAQFDMFKLRLMLNVKIADWIGDHEVTIFNDAGEKLLGKTAEEVALGLEEHGEKFLTGIFFRPAIFKLKAKVGQFMEEYRLNVSVVDVHPLNHKEFNRHLFEETKKLMRIE